MNNHVQKITFFTSKSTMSFPNISERRRFIRAFRKYNLAGNKCLASLRNVNSIMKILMFNNPKVNDKFLLN